MTRLVRTSLAAPWIGALLAFLTAVGVSAAQAQAGCSSHYITSRSTVHGGAGLDVLVVGESPGRVEEKAPVRRPAPCTSAFCTGNPAAPISTIPFLPTDSGSDWALSGSTLALNLSGSYYCWPDCLNIRPIDHAGSIFHPPRLPV
jgi:hypothetical protein